MHGHPVWQLALYNRFGSLLSELDTFACSEGWASLMGSMFEQVEQIEKTMEHEEFYEPVKFVQIKEKFGGLRAYYNGGVLNGKAVQRIYEIVNKAESKSFEVCEECGKPGKPSDPARWIQTLCKDCAAKKGVEVDDNGY